MEKRHDMHELMTIDVSFYPPKGLGEFTYEHFPHMDDWVEIEVDGVAFMYEVVKVAHSAQGHGADIYVRLLKDTPSAVRELCQPS
jgi:hypothetical protein